MDIMQRKVDELGRIVLPIEMRRALALEHGEPHPSGGRPHPAGKRGPVLPAVPQYRPQPDPGRRGLALLRLRGPHQGPLSPPFR